MIKRRTTAFFAEIGGFINTPLHFIKHWVERATSPFRPATCLPEVRSRLFLRTDSLPGYPCRSVRQVAARHRQVAWGARAGNSAFTMVGNIGALAVIAILVAVITPSVVRRVDHASWTRETTHLLAITNCYTP